VSKVKGIYALSLSLANALSGEMRGLIERDDGGNDVQYKSSQTCYYESPPLYNEYILIKN
jgi:hypothetical protein